MILLNALKLFRRILVLVELMAFPSQNAFIIRGVNNNLIYIYIYIYKESNFNVIIKYIYIYIYMFMVPKRESGCMHE